MANNAVRASQNKNRPKMRKVDNADLPQIETVICTDNCILALKQRKVKLRLNALT